MKTTKTEAKRIYDSFHGVMRCLNGGTREENERNAPRCLERLSQIGVEATGAIDNAGKLLTGDERLYDMVSELPGKAVAFGERYGLTSP